MIDNSVSFLSTSILLRKKKDEVSYQGCLLLQLSEDIYQAALSLASLATTAKDVVVSALYYTAVSISSLLILSIYYYRCYRFHTTLE